ncbi:MAG: hypothetical protein ABUL42_02920, partial [Terricaulis silvestris]
MHTIERLESLLGDLAKATQTQPGLGRSAQLISTYFGGVRVRLHTIAFASAAKTEVSDSHPVDAIDDLKGYEYEIRAGKISPVGVLTIYAEDEPDQSVIRAISYILQLAIERNWVSRLLDTIINPISVDASYAEYTATITRMICDAAQSRFAVLRMRSEDHRNSFDCIAFYDSLQRIKAQARAFDVGSTTPLYRFFSEIYLEATKTGQAKVYAINEGANSFLLPEVRALIGDDDVCSAFTIPMVLAGKCEGLLGFGYDAPLDFTEVEKSAVLALANFSAAAIQNHQNAVRLSKLRTETVVRFVENMNQELIQGLRHSARTSLSNTRNLASLLPSSIIKSKPDFESTFAKMTEQLTAIGVALDSMSSLRTAHHENRAWTDVVSQFEAAKRTLKSQLESAADVGPISVRINSPALNIFCEPVSLQNAFLLLLLNSIQAFSELRRANDPKITFNGRVQGDFVVLDISDNGPGIRIGKGDILEVPDIWDLGKTSRRAEGGTGYGL